MTTIHKYPNSNYGLIIEQEYERLWYSLQDYNDWLDRAISIDKSSRSLRNFNDKVFSNEQSLFLYLDEELNTNIGSYTEPMASNAKRNWEMALTMMNCTHGRPEAFMSVNYDKIAWTIWNERWKPAYQTHIMWLENRLEEADYEEIRTYFDEIGRHITYSNFDIFDGLEMDIDDMVEETREDDTAFIKMTRTWISHLENQMSTEEQNFSTSTLDMFIEFFHEMWISVSNFTIYTEDGEPCLSLLELMRETAVDLYLNKNPCVFLADVTEGRDNFMINAFDSSKIKHDSEDVDDANAFIIAESVEQASVVERGINQFLNGEWYYAKEIFIIPEGKEHLYDEFEEEDGIKFIETGESCGGFESEEDAIADFSYANKLEDMKPTISYSTLGNVQCVK